MQKGLERLPSLLRIIKGAYHAGKLVSQDVGSSGAICQRTARDQVAMENVTDWLGTMNFKKRPQKWQECILDPTARL